MIVHFHIPFGSASAVATTRLMLTSGTFVVLGRLRRQGSGLRCLTVTTGLIYCEGCGATLSGPSHQYVAGGVSTASARSGQTPRTQKMSAFRSETGRGVTRNGWIGDDPEQPSRSREKSFRPQLTLWHSMKAQLPGANLHRLAASGFVIYSILTEISEETSWSLP